MELLSADAHVRVITNNKPHSYFFSIEGALHSVLGELTLQYCRLCMINHVKGLLFMGML